MPLVSKENKVKKKKKFLGRKQIEIGFDLVNVYTGVEPLVNILMLSL